MHLFTSAHPSRYDKTISNYTRREILSLSLFFNIVTIRRSFVFTVCFRHSVCVQHTQAVVLCATIAETTFHWQELRYYFVNTLEKPHYRYSCRWKFSWFFGNTNITIHSRERQPEKQIQLLCACLNESVMISNKIFAVCEFWILWKIGWKFGAMHIGSRHRQRKR